MQIINAKIYTMSDGGIIDSGFITIDGGKIAQVGEMASYKSDASQIIDASGRIVTPGMIDGHCHLGVFGDGLGFEAEDANEATDPVTPHLRALDGINPLDHCFSEALAGGITTVVTGPGSANAIAGMSIVMKTSGICVDDMLIKSPAAMKFALGENPKTVYHGKNQSPETRMATAALIRDNLRKAQRYLDDLNKSKNAAPEDEIDPPEYDSKCESLLPLLRGELSAHFHAHRADDIFTAVRIANEFGLRYSIVHCTEGHLISSKLKCSGASVFVGPTLCDRSKPEMKNLDIRTAGVLNEEGILTAIVTDHPVIPIQYLPVCAALAVKGGMDKYEAMKAITVNPAKIMGISDRVGAISTGLDADIVIWNGDPLEILSKPEYVFVNGVRAK